MKFCKKCSTERPESDFHRDKSKRDGRQTVCKPCVSKRQKDDRIANPDKVERSKAYMRQWNIDNGHLRKEKDREHRRDAISRYGGKCQCCGVAEYEFLTFDHVGGWGATHRATTKYAWSIVKWLRREGFPQDGTIQLLCWNCNCARGVYGFCPHEAAPAALAA